MVMEGKTLKFFKIFIFLLGCLSFVNAQDISFTQFYAVPYQINPALTAAINGSYRVGLIYKDQWRNPLTNPFTTTAVGGEVKFDAKRQEKRVKDRFGIGLFFLNDRLNSTALTSSQISFSGSFQKVLNEKTNQFLGAGVQFSVHQRNVNYDQLDFGDEFNQLDGYNQQTAEVLPPNNLGFADLTVGLNYSISPSERNKFQAGFAAHHLLSPNASFFGKKENLNPAIDPNSDLLMRLVAHVSYDRQISEYLYVLPRLMYQQQGNDQEIRLGTNAKYFLPGFQNALFFGAWLSTINNIDGFSLNYVSPLVGIQLKSFIIGLSYDLNIRDLATNQRNFNALELSFRFNGDFYNDTGSCPEF